MNCFICLKVVGSIPSSFEFYLAYLDSPYLCPADSPRCMLLKLLVQLLLPRLLLLLLLPTQLAGLGSPGEGTLDVAELGGKVAPCCRLEVLGDC